MAQTETLYQKFSRHPVNTGRMNDPTGGAWIKGLCGDTMEMYLYIEDNIIREARFHTDGCGATLACGSLATRLVRGKHILEALKISPRQIIDELGDLPEENRHCAILAVNTLHKAIADYMLRY